MYNGSGTPARRPSTGNTYSGGTRSVRPSTGGESHRSAAVRPDTRMAPSSAGSSRIDGARRASSSARSYASGSAATRSYAGGNDSPRSHSAVRPVPGTRHEMEHGRMPASVRMHPHPGAAPRHHREPMALRGDPARFHSHGHHHYGHYLHTLPHHYVVHHYWGRDYYYYNDIWYRYYSGRYWVCRPPFGYVFSPVADAVYAACRFAYFFDNLYYYDTINDNARTIQEQNSTIAANNALIAQQNQTIAMNSSMAAASGSLAKSLGLVQSYADAGLEYFYNDGVFYTKGADGQYTVIVPPAGALVDSLPDDYELIELGGGTYYKVDDTVYRMTIDAEGKACFEVLGQLLS